MGISSQVRLWLTNDFMRNQQSLEDDLQKGRPIVVYEETIAHILMDV
jgi:hypothetical protein